MASPLPGPGSPASSDDAGHGRQAGSPGAPTPRREALLGRGAPAPDGKALLTRDCKTAPAGLTPSRPSLSGEPWLDKLLAQGEGAAALQRIRSFAEGREGQALPVARPGLVIDETDLRWVERLESLHVVQSRLPGLAMGASQRGALAEGLGEAIDRMSRTLMKAGSGKPSLQAADAQAAQAVNRPALLDAFLEAWPDGVADRAVDRDQARRTGRAVGLRLCGYSMGRKPRQECLVRWAAALGSAREASRQLQLTYFMQGFAWALSPRPPQSVLLARDMVESLCRGCGAPAEAAATAGEATDAARKRFIVGLRGIVLGLGCGLMSGEVLGAVLRTLLRPAESLDASDARRWLGSEGLAQALYNLVDVMGGKALPSAHLAVIVEHLLAQPAAGAVKARWITVLVQGLGGPDMGVAAGRLLLKALAGPGLQDRATRGLVLRALAAASGQAADPLARRAQLAVAGCDLPPASLWRLVEGLFRPQDEAPVLALPELREAVCATMAQAARLDASQRALLACCLGSLGQVSSLDRAGFDGLLASLEAPLKPGHTLPDVQRGLRLARDPQALWRDRELDGARRRALFGAIAQVPGVLTAQSSPRVLARLLQASLDGEERRGCVSLLFLHGAQFLPLTAFTTVRVLLTLELMALVEAGPAARTPVVESAVPKAVLDAYLQGLGDLTSLFEMLLPSRQLGFVIEQPLDARQSRARHEDIQAMRDYLRAQLRQVGRLGEPALLREALRAMLQAQLTPLERALASGPGHR